MMSYMLPPCPPPFLQADDVAQQLARRAPSPARPLAECFGGRLVQVNPDRLGQLHDRGSPRHVDGRAAGWVGNKLAVELSKAQDIIGAGRHLARRPAAQSRLRNARATGDLGLRQAGIEQPAKDLGGGALGRTVYVSVHSFAMCPCVIYLCIVLT